MIYPIIKHIWCIYTVSLVMRSGCTFKMWMWIIYLLQNISKEKQQAMEICEKRPVMYRKRVKSPLVLFVENIIYDLAIIRLCLQIGLSLWFFLSAEYASNQLVEPLNVSLSLSLSLSLTLVHSQCCDMIKIMRSE